jgi:hypothetical protein
MDRAEATGVGVAVAGHAALIALLAFGIAVTREPTPPTDAMEVSFVEEAGPVSSAPETLETPAPAIGEDVAAPDAASGADASVAEPIVPPVPEPVRPPVETGERRRPDVTRNPVTIRPQPQPRVVQAQPRLQQRPSQPQPRPQRTRTFADVVRSVGGGAPAARNPASAAPAAPAAPAATPQVRASIRSVIASELNEPRCRAQNFPAPEARAIQVTMTVSLERDGSLAGTSNIRISNDDPGLARYEGRVRELALALLRCAAPFQRLAGQYPEFYNSWRQFPYRFPIRN